MKAAHLRLLVVAAWCLAVLPPLAGASVAAYVCRFNLEASPQGVKKPDAPFELRFIVDSSTSKAYLMGNNGSAEVELIRNKDGLSFVEITKSGNVMVTTIVSKSGQAVHSRNGIMFNELVPSQFYGTCGKNP